MVGSTKLVLLRLLSLLVLGTCIHFLWMFANQRQPISGISTKEVHDSSWGIRSRYSFKSYEEYVKLQLNKTLNPKLRNLWITRDWNRKVEVFSAIFKALMDEGLLRSGSNALCIAARVGQEVAALRKIGVKATGIDLVAYPPLVKEGDMHKHPFPNNSFHFEFSNAFDHALYPRLFVSEIERTLKPGGIAVLHVAANGRGDKYSVNDLDSPGGVIALFQNSTLLHMKEVDAFGLDTQITLRKNSHIGSVQVQ